MKKLLLVFALIFICVFVSCSDDDSSNPQSPDLQYVGSWTAESANDSIHVKVSNVNNIAMITEYAIRVRRTNGSMTMTQRTSSSSSLGLTEVSNGAFTVTEAYVSIVGQFTSVNSLTVQYILDENSGTITITK